jgi:hypothetical protein
MNASGEGQARHLILPPQIFATKNNIVKKKKEKKRNIPNINIKN